MNTGINTATAILGGFLAGVPGQVGGAIVRPRAVLDRLVAFIRPHH